MNKNEQKNGDILCAFIKSSFHCTLSVFHHLMNKIKLNAPEYCVFVVWTSLPSANEVAEKVMF